MYTTQVQQNIIYCKKQRNNFMQMQIPRKTNNNAIELIIIDFRIIKTIVGSFEQKLGYTSIRKDSVKNVEHF